MKLNKLLLTTLTGVLILNVVPAHATPSSTKKHHQRQASTTSYTSSSYAKKHKNGRGNISTEKEVAQVDVVTSTTVDSTVPYRTFVPHPYLGLNVGVANSHNYAKADPPPSWNSLVDISTEGNLAAGGFIGYNFTPIFAAELGFTHYTGARLRDTVQRGSNVTYGSQRIPSQAVDLLARVNIPLNNHSEIYIKGGPAWVVQSSASEDVNIGGTVTTVDIIKKANQIVPEAGAGIAFFSEKSGKFQIGYNRLFGLNNISSIDYVYASVSYPLGI